MIKKLIPLLIVPILFNTASAHDPATEMLDAANTLLAALDETQQSKIKIEFEDKLRKDWQFIPMERAGLGLSEMKVSQRHLAMSLLQSALSHRGFSTSMKIMALEQVLHEMENNAPKRDPSKYHLFIFGEPSPEKTWGWRVEGHHLSVSFTIVEGRTVVSTPSFFGSNPGEVRVGQQKGLRVLADEEDLGRALVKNLTIEQKKSAIIQQEVPGDVINGPGVVAKPLGIGKGEEDQQGIAAGDMTPQQQKMLRDLIDVYVGKLRPELAEQDMKKIEEAGFDKIHFAWIGKIQPGQPHYYRVQGPTFIMEYDNRQNKANHIHTVWRDFNGDFGEDLLKKHLEAVPHAPAKKTESIK